MTPCVASRCALLWFVSFFTLAVSGWCEPPVESLKELHTREAKDYRIYTDASRQQLLDFRSEPVMSWTNLVGDRPQIGHIYVWTERGRPEAIGTIFSVRSDNGTQRKLVHEFHTLSTRQLVPVTPPGTLQQWTPQRGIMLSADGDLPVGKTAAERLRQIRQLARSFTAISDKKGERWELRLLSTPLLRYEPATNDVLDGALFAMVSSAGTDPEAVLVIEARDPQGKGTSWVWHSAAVRFSDRDLVIQRAGQRVWSSLEQPEYRVEIRPDFSLLKTADKTYMCYVARIIDELPSP